jgi:hypothetical protein
MDFEWKKDEIEESPPAAEGKPAYSARSFIKNISILINKLINIATFPSSYIVIDIILAPLPPAHNSPQTSTHFLFLQCDIHFILMV